MSWRDIAKKVIAKAMEEVGPDFDKISKNYYPFGDRKYHPYHIWLDEIARQRKEHQPLKDEQEELFPGGDPKYTIESLREQLETQAQVLAARDAKIERMDRDYRAILSARADTIENHEKRIAERDKVIERQERMIGMACEWLQKLGCPVLDDHYCDENCSTEMNGSGCWRRWLEQEAQHD